MDVFKVRGAGNSNKVIIWERDPLHPDGEAFVVDSSDIAIVGKTARIKRLVAEGKIVEVVESPKNEDSGGEANEEEAVAPPAVQQAKKKPAVATS